MRLSALSICLLGLMGMGILGCGGQWNIPETVKELKNPIPLSARNLTDARRTYAERCAHCHGVNGDGKRPKGTVYFYLVQPTDFTDAKIMDAMTDGEIYWKITTGNRPMPSYRKQLTDRERWELVDLLRAFAHPPGNPAASSTTSAH